ncbi:MAG: N-acetylmuramoyl-L-alanine amidase [Bdellovibrio sp.]|nr:N-acetylmuramoyl-L-alanine amidase [Bdellovibrio sp.]
MRLKKILRLIVLFYALYSTQNSFAFINHDSFRIVIDPGHGGPDFGAVFYDGSRQITEKELTLLLSQEITTQLRTKGFDVILTRTNDVDVPLPVRTALANKLQANVFLSIHINSTTNPASEAEGFETYILNNTTDESSRRLARLENQILSHKKKPASTELDVALILKDLQLDANLTESKQLACLVQENISKSITRFKQCKNRGVKQALFHVLLGADMPSILIEAGFISNEKDRNLILSDAGRKTLALAITNAIDQYKFQKNATNSENMVRISGKHQNLKNILALYKCKVH